MTEEANEAVSKDELADAIAGEFGHAKAPEFLRKRLEQYYYAAVDPEDLEQQRERLRAIERDCLQAAKSVWLAPQEPDWFPKGIAGSPAPALTRDRLTALFADNIRKVEQAGNRPATDFLRRQLKKFESGTLKFEQEKVEPLVQAVIGPTELSLLLDQVSKAAGRAADGLPPKRKARGIPKEELAAHYGRLLIQEFYRLPLRRRPLKRRPLKRRSLRKFQFPWSKFLTVTAFFYEYVFEEYKKAERFETACRKVLKETGDRKSD